MTDLLDISAAARELVEAGRRLTDLDLSPGSSGNLSVRVERGLLVTPTGVSLGELEPDGLSLIAPDGTLLDGPAPTKEHPFHRALTARDARARAVVHVHSRGTVAASVLAPWSENSAIPPLTPYFVMRVGQTPLIPYAPPGDPQQAEVVRHDERTFRAVLLQNHGAVVAGSSLSAALDATVELEEACRLAVSVAGREVRTLTDAEALTLADRYGTPWTPVHSH